MGALIRYTPDPFKPREHEVRRTIAGITAQDAVRATFPDLGDVPVFMQRNGRALYGDDMVQEGDVIYLALRPEWFAAAAGAGFWTQLGYHVLNAFIYAAVSYLISGLLRPKGKKDKQASPAYSVAIDQNAARLAGTIPVQYGRCIAMPDIASQPYAEFVAHNERVSMILCLGMGEYTINDIFLGESRVVDFPPGNVVTWIFKPSDHGRMLGNIERVTGVVEDMLTIPESMGVDLAAPNDPPEVAVAGSVSGGTLMPNNPQSQLWTGLIPGRRYVVTNSLGGRVVVGYVGVGPNNSAVFDGPLPAPPAEHHLLVTAQLTAIDDAKEGRMMLLYSQQEIPQVAIGEIIYVRDDTNQQHYGPFQLARSEVRWTRLYLRMSGLGFTAESGEAGFWPQRRTVVIRNRFVTYYVTEYVEGTNPGEDYRWRGWYATSRPSVQVDAVYVDITLPNGLAWVTDDGGYKNEEVQFAVDIQQVDDSGNPVGGVDRRTINMTGATSTARRVTYKYTVAPGRYRVRIARTNTRDQRASKEISQSTLASIRARIYHPAGTSAYENCTLLVMQFTASAGLNAASNRRVTVDCTRLLPAMGRPEWGMVSGWPTRDAFVDAYTNTDYGGARPWSEMDTDKVYVLGDQWATTNGFNGIFDSETTLIEALQAILAPVKALPLPTGKIMSVVQDCPRPRYYAFGDDTIIKDSLSLAYLFDGENQNDCLCILYRDPRTFVESRAFYPSEGVNPEVIDLFGCTSRDHALAWGKLSWQIRMHNRKRCTLQLEGEGYLLDPLDRFGVTLQSTLHGNAGRCIQYDANTHIMLCDCEVPPDTTMVQFIGADGALLSHIGCVRHGPQELQLYSDPNTDVHGAMPDADATAFVLLRDFAQFYEFGVTDLRTGGDLKVEVTGQQYSDAAYAGTFVESWITGD